MEKAYEHKKVEEKWYRFWEDNKYFTPEKAEEIKGKLKEKFSMVIPPPNVTGVLHIGHALNVSIQDMLARFYRLNGRKVLWIPGTDHAGIATQNVVERQLLQEGIKREDLGREKFIEKVWEWKKEKGGIIVKQLRKLGASCDWTRERFTMDEELSKAVRKVFVELYRSGLIYQGKYMVNWCPRCKTALANDEVEYESKKSNLWYIKYPVVGEEIDLVVATTRPETMLGDTAVAVNPNDERYKDLIGKKVLLPLVNKQIPIVADEYVDMEFGTGVVKITPAHDPNDWEVAQRHNLPSVVVIDENGNMTEEAGEFAGLDRFTARKKIVEKLEEEGYLEKIEDYSHNVGHCYRCHTVIEPYYSKQWFVKMRPLADMAMKAVKDGKIRFIPSHWVNLFFAWLRDVKDWCISRQIWWGHRIPVWICQDCGHINVSEDDVKKCEKCSSENLKQEEDVLDTWFSSALWPFSTLGWPKQTKDLEEYYPTSCLVTAFDIIYFWVARMIMMGLFFMKKEPFKDVYIHGLIRDSKGKKMSKSAGNAVDPLQLIEKYGADALRLTMLALIPQGKDLKFSEKILGEYRTFLNKLWNAARYIFMDLEEKTDDFTAEDLKPEDKWIIYNLAKVAESMKKDVKDYMFQQATLSIYHFVWDKMCDWYIEFTKKRKREKERTVQRVLLYVLKNVLILLHPIIPFITEEIYQLLPNKSRETIVLEDWPEIDLKKFDMDDIAKIEAVISVINEIRTLKGIMRIPVVKKVKVYIDANEEIFNKLVEFKEHFINLAGVEELIKGEKIEGTVASTVAVFSKTVKIYVDLQGHIDIEKELERLNKKLNKLEKERINLSKKLNNKEFVEKAPEHVVEMQKERLKQVEEEEKNLKAIINSIK